MHNIYFTTEAAYEAVKEELWSNGAKYPRPLIVDVIETGKVYFDDNEEHFGTVNATVTDGTIKATVNGAEVALPYRGSVGEAVVFEVIPDDGKKFDKWSDGNMDNPRTVTIIEADKVFEAECVEDAPAIPMYLTFEGAVDQGMPVLLVTYNEDMVVGSGLEWSIEDTPTTWHDPVFDDGKEAWTLPDHDTVLAGGYTKLHIRAKDGGNTKVAGLDVIAKKVSGPIISLLDNTCSITSMPVEAFYYWNEDDGIETGFFMQPWISGDNYIEDISGMVFPDFTSDSCYALFASEQTTLTKIPAVLPAKHVCTSAYNEMFSNTNLCEIGGEMTILAENFLSEDGERVGDCMFTDVSGSNKFSVHVHTCNNPDGDLMDVENIAKTLGIFNNIEVYAIDENGNEGQFSPF